MLEGGFSLKQSYIIMARKKDMAGTRKLAGRDDDDRRRPTDDDDCD